MAVDHAHIRKILDAQDKNADNSLRGKSLQRALGQQVPKTLTAHEWESWYAEHGIPDSHKKKQETTKKAWWRIWSD